MVLILEDAMLLEWSFIEMRFLDEQRDRNLKGGPSQERS